MNYKILILKNVNDSILKTLKKKGPYVHKRTIKSKPKTLIISIFLKCNQFTDLQFCTSLI